MIKIKTCPFCKGLGVAEYIDLEDVKKLEQGTHEIKDLVHKKTTCPECIKQN